MHGKYKKFDKGLYHMFDSKAKNAVYHYLIARGHDVHIPEEDMGADLYHIDRQGRTVHHEVEVSRCYWHGDDFVGNETSIPERKSRLLSYGYDYLLHWMLNVNYTRACVTNMNLYCIPKFLREMSNRYVKQGEFFYKIPLKHCKVVTL